MISTAEADHTTSITETVRETALTGQDHTIKLNVTKAPVSTGDMHPALYPTTTAACNTLPQTDALGGTPMGTPTHTVTDTTHPGPDTLHTGATLTTTSLTTVSVAQATPLILPVDCIHKRHQSHIHGQQPL